MTSPRTRNTITGYLMLLIYSMVLFPVLAVAQSAASLPVAMTVTVTGAPVTTGTVVSYEEVTGRYVPATTVDDASVYGVIAERPAVVFTTASNTVPVVTSGIALVRVDTSRGVPERGDVLVSAGESGVASVAYEEDEHVFAIVLEDYYESNTPGFVTAEIGKSQALARHTALKEMIAQEEALLGEGGGAGSAASTTVTDAPPYVRLGLAGAIALGALGFVLYTFRSLIVNAAISVGRNPRAQGAILTLSIGNIIFTLILCGVILFVALAVLVLPVP